MKSIHGWSWIYQFSKGDKSWLNLRARFRETGTWLKLSIALLKYNWSSLKICFSPTVAYNDMPKIGQGSSGVFRLNVRYDTIGSRVHACCRSAWDVICSSFWWVSRWRICHGLNSISCLPYADTNNDKDVFPSGEMWWHLGFPSEATSD